MKRSAFTSNRIQNAFASATEYELIVSEILLDLGEIIYVSESTRSQFTWGAKRRRSSLDEGVSYSRAPSSSAQGREDESDQRRSHVKAEENFQAAAAAAAASSASPNTPLSFSPSESDENNHFIDKNSMKMSRDQYINLVEQLSQSRDCLIGEIETVKKYCKKLKAQNSELKAKKQEVLKTYHREEDPRMVINRQMNHRTELAQNCGNATMPYHKLADQNFQYRFGPITTQLDLNVLGPVNHVGPLGIPDLNISAEEAFGLEISQPLDLNAVIVDKRARFAEARRLRRGMITIKAMRSACGITLPSRS